MSAKAQRYATLYLRGSVQWLLELEAPTSGRRENTNIGYARSAVQRPCLGKGWFDNMGLASVEEEGGNTRREGEKEGI
jgi:hypothetical protein